MSVSVEDALRVRVKNLDAMPAMPAILWPLLRALDLPPDQIEVEKVTEMISHDKSVAAQCLRMANSALFQRHSSIETIRGAVIALGARRLRDVLWSSFLIRFAPKNPWPLDPAKFWEHSFGCALVCQQLAKKVSLPDPDRVYLCGLLHDIGELVNATLFPEEFRATVESATANGSSLFEAEKATLGFTHCDTGKLLAEFWNLPYAIQGAIQFHHTPEDSPAPSALPALVNLSDFICRVRGMGYGYDELCEIEFQNAPAWALLEKAVPKLESFDVARFTLELDESAEEIRKLVASTFQG
jgi:HD-like signal output (HDOD) protein